MMKHFFNPLEITFPRTQSIHTHTHTLVVFISVIMSVKAKIYGLSHVTYTHNFVFLFSCIYITSYLHIITDNYWNFDLINNMSLHIGVIRSFITAMQTFVIQSMISLTSIFCTNYANSFHIKQMNERSFYWKRVEVVRLSLKWRKVLRKLYIYITLLYWSASLVNKIRKL